MADPANALKGFLVLRSLLEGHGWHPKELRGRHVYGTTLSGNHGTFTCYAQIKLELNQFVFYVMAPVKAAPDQRCEIAELFARANRWHTIGNFELDMSDGEMRYKSGLDFEGTELDPRLIASAVYPAIQAMDRHWPGILAVLEGTRTAEQALTLVHGT